MENVKTDLHNTDKVGIRPVLKAEFKNMVSLSTQIWELLKMLASPVTKCNCFHLREINKFSMVVSVLDSASHSLHKMLRRNRSSSKDCYQGGVTSQHRLIFLLVPFNGI